jgi:branched-chain amino acid transport system ATP-binding protein
MADLEVEAIHTAYGLSRVLFGVSLEVHAGECIALIGRNGVGKTTTMRSIIGLTPPASGRVVWKGRDIARLGPHRICRMGIGFVPEDRRIFPELTVWENLDIARRIGPDGTTTWREEQVFALFPDLKEIRDRRGGVLSGGQQQMLTIARTLMGNPELLLLDEPSEGLAPLIVEQLCQRVGELKATGLSIVLAEQNLQFVMALADRVYILEKGEVRFIGTPADLQADKSIVQQFLTNDGAGLIAASLVDPDRQGARALSPATPLKGGPWDGERWIRVSNPPPLAPVRTVSPA